MFSRKVIVNDELTMLNARLMQWCLLNMQATHAFECRKESSEARLWAAWESLSHTRQELLRTQRRFNLEREITALQRLLNLQREILVEVVRSLENFKGRYISFASSLASTTSAMPITDIQTGELDKLTDCINECSLMISGILENYQVELPSMDEVSRSLRDICANMKEEAEEINECNALLKAIVDAETMERSLRIQKIEAVAKDYQPARLD